MNQDQTQIDEVDEYDDEYESEKDLEEYDSQEEIDFHPKQES